MPKYSTDDTINSKSLIPELFDGTNWVVQDLVKSVDTDNGIANIYIKLDKPILDPKDGRWTHLKEEQVKGTWRVTDKRTGIVNPKLEPHGT